MAILVTGGAGYIGSVAVRDLLDDGEEVVVVDNLVYGHRQAIDSAVAFFEGDIGDQVLIGEILEKHEINAVMHFSAFAYVGESVEDPAKYWENNVSQSIRFFNEMLAGGVKKFIFSSTCATYGEPQYVPIDEKHPQSPTNPYGWSKLIIERMLENYDTAYNARFVSLRYFNASGATDGCGEDHDPETHLIPLVLQTAQGKREQVSIFGDDYPTPDGTAIRDYIHVSDLSQAHLLALRHITGGGSSEFINLGNGNGHSVRDVIETAEKVTGRQISTAVKPRRSGDPSKLVADSQKAREVLGWNPKYSELEQIIESAWKWHKAHPQGYQD